MSLKVIMLGDCDVGNNKKYFVPSSVLCASFFNIKASLLMNSISCSSGVEG